MNRLAEFQKRGGFVPGARTVDDDIDYTFESIREKQQESSNDDGEEHDENAVFLVNFFFETKDIKERIDIVLENAKELESIYKNMLLVVTNAAKTKQLVEKSDALRRETMNELSELKVKYLNLTKHVASIQFLSAEYRIRKNQLEVIGEQLEEALVNVNRIVSNHKDAEEEQTKRRIKIFYKSSGEEVTDEKLVQLMQQPKDVLFKTLVTKNQLHMVNTMAQDLSERHAELLQMELEMSELVEMYRDMNVLIRDRQTQLNSLEDTVLRTNYQLQRMRKEIKIARKRDKCVIM